jgi:hypothetical protein
MANLPSSTGDEFDFSASGLVRPFGVLYPAQSRIYLMNLPLAMILTGLVTWLLPTNESFVLGAAVGSLVGLYILVDVTFREAPLRLSLLLAMTLLIGYNLGALNSWLTIPRAGLTIAEYFTRDPAALARATGACMFSASLLLIAGQLFEPPIFGRDFRVNFDERSVLIVFASTLMMVVGYASGQIGYMGVKTDDAGHTSVYGALLLWWSAPALAYSVCATLNTKGLVRVAVGGCTLIQILALIPTGRRTFAFALLLSLIGSRLGGYRSRLSVWKKLFLSTMGIALIFVASIAFLYLRIAGFTHKSATSSIGNRISQAAETFQGGNLGEMVDLLRTNASTRTFNIGYFSDLLDASQHNEPLYGAVAMHNLQLMVPSSISADKFGLDPYGEEELVDMKWGFGFTDEANSIITGGVADFGFIGVLLYPLLAVLLLRGTLEAIQYAMPTYGAVIMALAFIYVMLLAELTLFGYFGQIRNALIFAFILYVLSLVPKVRLHSPGGS